MSRSTYPGPVDLDMSTPRFHDMSPNLKLGAPTFGPSVFLATAGATARPGHAGDGEAEAHVSAALLRLGVPVFGAIMGAIDSIAS